MFRIASTFAAIAALTVISASVVPAMAAVQIESSIELALPDFMPEVAQGTIIVLDERAGWPALR